jgi:hypothetical protein
LKTLALLSVLILSTIFLNAQESTSLKLNTRLKADVSLENDTIYISSRSGFILDVYVIKRVSRATSVRSSVKILEYGFNHYRIPMDRYDLGTYTVVVNYAQDLYPFNFIRQKPIIRKRSAATCIVSYYCVTGTIQNFGQSESKTGKLSKYEIFELVQKAQADLSTRNGSSNWLKIYAVYNDHSEKLIYEIN